MEEKHFIPFTLLLYIFYKVIGARMFNLSMWIKHDLQTRDVSHQQSY